MAQRAIIKPLREEPHVVGFVQIQKVDLSRANVVYLIPGKHDWINPKGYRAGVTKPGS